MIVIWYGKGLEVQVGQRRPKTLGWEMKRGLEQRSDTHGREVWRVDVQGQPGREVPAGLMSLGTVDLGG